LPAPMRREQATRLLAGSLDPNAAGIGRPKQVGSPCDGSRPTDSHLVRVGLRSPRPRARPPRRPRDRHPCCRLRLQPWADGRGPGGTRAAPAALVPLHGRGEAASGNEAAGAERSPDQLRPAGPRKTLPRRRFFLRAPLFSASVGAFLTGRSFSVRAIAQDATFRRHDESRSSGWRGRPLHRGRARHRRRAAGRYSEFAKREPSACAWSAPVACCVRVPVLRNAVSRLPN
jgi:hypothetical protein